MEEIFEAGIEAGAEVLGEVVEAVVIGSGGSGGSDPKKKKERGCCGCVIICVILGLIATPFLIQNNDQKDAIKETTALVKAHVNNVDIETLEPIVKDSWGNVLRVSKTKALVRWEIVVRSAGIDGEINTADDIVAKKSRFK